MQIAYSTADKRFLMPYSYSTKTKLVRNVNPRPKTFSNLATQVLRAKQRGVTAIGWQNPVANAVLSLEGTFAECGLYRYENGNLVTVFSSNFPNVLRYVGMVSKSGTDEHKNARIGGPNQKHDHQHQCSLIASNSTQFQFTF